jgi:hypothetical protein
MLSIAARIRYDIGLTDAATPAASALARGHGVCQDHAHVFVSAARGLGFPARYVSGHLFREDGRTLQEAGHAWAEAHVPGLGWVGFDPSNGVSPTDAYVRIAVGLDYLEAAPVRGTRYGGGEESLEVRITVDQGSLTPRGSKRATRMTYCVGLLVHEGLVMIADTRTNAGVDNIATVRKLFVFETPGERMIALAAAGNLSLSQSVVSLLAEGMEDTNGGLETIRNVPSMFGAARLAGRAIRKVYETDAAALEQQNMRFEVSLLLGGQIGGWPLSAIPGLFGGQLHRGDA